jgi:hypothetical protein
VSRRSIIDRCACDVALLRSLNMTVLNYYKITNQNLKRTILIQDDQFKNFQVFAFCVELDVERCAVGETHQNNTPHSRRAHFIITAVFLQTVAVLSPL